MKIPALLFALLLPTLAAAGAYEDMEEALIAGDTAWAIQLINRGGLGRIMNETGLLTGDLIPGLGAHAAIGRRRKSMLGHAKSLSVSSREFGQPYTANRPLER